jgi:uncharacterized membrane protein
MSAAAEQEQTVIVEASQQDCFDVITDFATYPGWNSALRAARVEKHSRGLARQVAFELDARVKTIRYVLEYSYKKPGELTWKSVGGDVNSIVGSYRFEKVDENRTRATCRQHIDLGFWLPGPIRRLAESTALKQAVAEFKAEVESRVAAKSKPTRRKR